MSNSYTPEELTPAELLCANDLMQAAEELAQLLTPVERERCAIVGRLAEVLYNFKTAQLHPELDTALRTFADEITQGLFAQKDGE